MVKTIRRPPLPPAPPGAFQPEPWRGGRALAAFRPPREPIPKRQPDEARVPYAWRVLDTVPDPEVPVLSVCDLGIVRDIVECASGLEVVLTPTYSGCPATETIEGDVREALDDAGLGPARVTRRLAPAWTSDWISERGHARLREYGIAPPGRAECAPVCVVPRLACPRCGSRDTEQLSAFGPTACKSIYRCRACMEPFEHFKPL